MVEDDRPEIGKELADLEESDRAAKALVVHGSVSSAITILRSGDEKRIVRVIQSATSMLAIQFANKEINKRKLSSGFKQMMILDDSRYPGTAAQSFERVRQALENLPGDDMEIVLAALPVSIVEKKLDRMDQEFCSPKRMASYMRNSCSTIMFSIKKLNYKTSHKRGAYVEMEYKAYGDKKTRFINLLGDIFERVLYNPDEDDYDYAHDVAKSLQNKDHEVPEYVVEALKDLSDKGDENAQRFLELIDVSYRDLSDFYHYDE